MSSPAPAKIRLTYLDIAKGISIILVVTGHLMARSGPPGPDWYLTFHRVIYLFHMPLFMALAGMTFGSALPRQLELSGYWRVVWPRVQRLLIPYIIFGVVIVAGKILAAKLIHVDNQPQSFIEEMWSLLLFPRRGATSFLWFIYVLMMYQIVLTLLIPIGRIPVTAIMVIGIAANFLVLPDFLLIDEVIEFLPFFCFGMILMANLQRMETVFESLGWLFVLMFAAGLLVAIYSHVPKWFLGLLSIPAVLFISQKLPARPGAWLSVVGISTFSIYLMNTIVIGLTKAALLPLLSWNDANFIVFFIVCSLLGTTVPIAIGRWTKQNTPRIGRYI